MDLDGSWGYLGAVREVDRCFYGLKQEMSVREQHTNIQVSQGSMQGLPVFLGCLLTWACHSIENQSLTRGYVRLKSTLPNNLQQIPNLPHSTQK